MIPPKAEAFLDDATVVWLTTVTEDGQPQSSPVWFIMDAGDFLIYSADSARIANIEANPRVALNLDSNAGEDVVTVEGVAQVANDPPSTEKPDYQKKYGTEMAAMGYTPEGFDADYPIPIRVRPTRWRLF
jgi:PPOX class probable F420-dependent enzyme